MTASMCRSTSNQREGDEIDLHDLGTLTHVWLAPNSRLCSAEPISSPALNLTALTGRKRKALPLMQDLLRSVQYLHLSESCNLTPTCREAQHGRHVHIYRTAWRLTFDVTLPARLAVRRCSVLRHVDSGIDEPSASLSHFISCAILLEGDLSTAAGGVSPDGIARFEAGKWHPFLFEVIIMGLALLPRSLHFQGSHRPPEHGRCRWMLGCCVWSVTIQLLRTWQDGTHCHERAR